MSVAIRAVTRIQDQDDINVTPGAGVDEYALCWDNDTNAFALRAVHAPVTLDVNANTLFSLSTQALGLDTQTANHALIGPIAGAAAVPSFRTLALADLPVAVLFALFVVSSGAPLTSQGEMTWQS